MLSVMGFMPGMRCVVFQTARFGGQARRFSRQIASFAVQVSCLIETRIVRIVIVMRATTVMMVAMVRETISEVMITIVIGVLAMTMTVNS
jgi:hypothetical protein